MIIAAQPLNHEITLLFLSQLALLLGVARLLGEAVRRLDQPAVLGELIAGLLLGPSVFGLLAPQAHLAVFPADQQLEDLLSAFSLIGVLLLLIVTGLEIDLELIGRKVKTAALGSAGGLLVTFPLGLGLGLLTPDSFLVRPEQRTVFCLFMAVNLSISAIPVIAKVLMDLKAIRRDIGQINLATAMIDDAVGWILLGVAAGLAATGSVTPPQVAYSLGVSALVMGLGLGWGRILVHRFLALLERWMPGESPQLTGIIFLALAFAILTHGLGLESMLGAFLAGILVGQSSRLKNQVAHTLESFTSSFFAPLFFASAGLKVNLPALCTPRLLTLTLAVLLVAGLGKTVGCYLGGWAGGLSHWQRLTLGAGMAPRGAMGVIVARIGLGLGILSQDVYSVMIAMAIITSLVAPPLLRYCLAHVEITPEEQRRLKQEAVPNESFLHSLRKVLLPSRGGDNASVAAHLLGHLSHHHPVEITALFTQPGGEAPAPQSVEALHNQLRLSRGPTPSIKSRAAKDVAQAILQESEEGDYDLVVIGATKTGPSQRQNPLIDRILSEASCATMVVRAHPNFNPSQGEVVIHRLLIPVVGTEYSLRATEVASVLSRSLQATITLLHIIPCLDDDHGPHAHELSQQFAHRILDHHADVARSLGAQVETRVVENDSASQAILATAADFDLIFMGTGYRPVGGRAFLGHRAENVLRSAPCAAVVLSSG